MDITNKKGVMSWGKVMIYLLLVVNMCFMAGLLYYVANYTEELSANPLTYGANKFNIRSCECITYSLKELHFNSTNVWTITYFNNSNKIYIPLNLSQFSGGFQNGTS